MLTREVFKLNLEFTGRSGAKANVRVDFSSTHGYSTPCGNATALYQEFLSFTEAIGRSSRPNTTMLITEWSADPDPAGVGCNDVYDPGTPVIKNYHDTAAQATFAVKTVFLIDGIVPLLSHWAFSDVRSHCRCLVFSGH